MTFRVSANSLRGSDSLIGGVIAKVRTQLSRVPAIFLWIVVVPALLAAIYFFSLASPVYVSEAQFIVRAPTQPQPTGIDAVLQGVGLAPASTDSFVVHDYIMSRDAITDLAASHHLRE